MRKNFQRPIAVLAAACILSTGFTGFSQNTSIVYAAETEDITASALEAGVYSVPVSLMNASNISSTSMAASCIANNGVLTVNEDGTMSIQVTLQTLSLNGLYGNASDIKVYSSYTNYSTSATLDATVDTTRTGKSGLEASYSETTVPEKVSITLPYTDQNGVYVSMYVDAMNMSTDAFLSIDFDNAVNIASLNEQMTKAESIAKANFTESSLASFETAYEAAKNLLATTATSEEIETAAADLKNAIDTLVLVDGTYTVPVTIYKSNSDTESVMATGIEKTATITVKDGKVSMDTTLLPVSHYGFTGYVSDVKTFYDVTLDESGAPSVYSTYDSEVLSTYDIVDDYNSADSSLTEVAGVMYPKDIKLTLDNQDRLVWISMYVPSMAAMGHGTQIVRLYTDYALAAVLSDEETGSEDTVVEETAIVLNATSATVTAGKTTTLKATVTGQGATSTVTYTSSKPSVATVSDKGVVTGVKAGTTTITATVDGKTATCLVTVKAAPTIKLNKTTATIYTSGTKTVQLTATVTGDSQTVSYTSSKPSVATVSKTGKVTAVKAGTTTITATANGVSTTAKITVTKAALTVSKTSATIYTAGTKTIQLKATVTGASKTVTYKSSKTSVAKVSSTGKVTAVKAGTATITVTSNGISKTVKITVKKATLTVSETTVTVKKTKTYKISAKATPTSKITYKSSKTSVATVSSTGVIKAKKAGTCTITVKANGVTKKIKVTVK